jgi:hypothetical protein
MNFKPKNGPKYGNFLSKRTASQNYVQKQGGAFLKFVTGAVKKTLKGRSLAMPGLINLLQLEVLRTINLLKSLLSLFHR